MNSALIIFTALTLTPFIVSGFDMTSCRDLKPSGNVAAQTSPAPFALTVTPNVFAGGIPINVTLMVTTSSETYVDFLLVAQCPTCPNTTIPVGTFNPIPPGTKLLSCYSTKGAVTASNFNTKTTLTFLWTPPIDLDQPVVMKASVVGGTNIWWENIKSSPITIIVPLAAPKSTSTLPPIRKILPTQPPTTMTPPTTRKTTMTPKPPTTESTCGSTSVVPSVATLLMFAIAVTA